MDSLTHIALGACMGELFAGKQLGKKAMLWGALAQSIPDIDFICSAWMDTPSALLAHRGFTHSFLFVILISLLMALLAEKFHRPHNIGFRRWWLFFAAAVGVHIFIDAFNNYGVGWWEPFSHERISFQAIYVVDPLFSIWPGIALLAMLLVRRKPSARKWWCRIGLLLPLCYLFICWGNKVLIQRQLNHALSLQHKPRQFYMSTPAPLQNALWFVVAGDTAGFYAGYRSLLDHTDTIQWQYFPRNTAWLKQVDDQVAVQQLVRFSQGYYTVEKSGTDLLLNDLRFGQTAGWLDAQSPFAFHYYLTTGANNRMVVQRGRFNQWNKAVLISLWKRMQGN